MTLLSLIAVAVLATLPGAISQGVAASLAPLSISGNQVLAGGTPIHFHGANRSGSEYACVQNWGIFDGPSDQASITAMLSWNVNIVRIPINEDCWLDVNRGGNSTSYYGSSYQSAIVSYVNLLHSNGIYAEVSLIWAAPGTYQATNQPGAPDADHSPALWSSLAATFKNDPGVILAPWGETTVDWSCFRNGGTCSATYGPSNTPYATAGMQQAVSLMRQAGFAGPIAIPCIEYANDCSDVNGSWLSNEPSDPNHALLAEAHVYGKNTCSSVTCFAATLLATAQSVPMIWAETGESYDASDCGSSFVSAALPWALQNTSGVVAWAWDTWGGCGVLITDYSGAPNGAYGTWVKTYFASLAPTSGPPPPPPSSAGGGYAILTDFGGIYTFGDATYRGNLIDHGYPGRAVSLSETPDGSGYAILTASGTLYTFGNALYFGNLVDHGDPGPAISVSYTPSGGGYAILTTWGGLYTFGNASYFGNLVDHGYPGYAVALAYTPSGRGYYILTDAGAIYTFGDAAYMGNLLDHGYPGRAVGLAATRDGGGYAILTAAGALYTFGDAFYAGNLLDHGYPGPAVGISVTP